MQALDINGCGCRALVKGNQCFECKKRISICLDDAKLDKWKILLGVDSSCGSR
jgi:hypothetical protein